MNTLFLLMAQYNGQAIIPVDTVCADYFSHLSPKNLRHTLNAYLCRELIGAVLILPGINRSHIFTGAKTVSGSAKCSTGVAPSHPQIDEYRQVKHLEKAPKAQHLLPKSRKSGLPAFSVAPMMDRHHSENKPI